ncbi:hypothetical protein HDV04_002679, partial [Boothiomyces sp. JEL0838]
VLIISIVPLVIINDFTISLGSFGLGVYAGLITLYDNLQIFYLAYLIMNYKKIKTKGSFDEVLYSEYRKIVVFNFKILAMDWLGFLLYAYNTFDNSGYDCYYAIGGLICCCLHAIGMVLLLQKFTKLSVTKSKPVVKQITSVSAPATLIISK